MTAMRRILLSATAALVWVGLTAAPASAHSVSGVSATNFHTHLRSVTPEVPGLVVKVIEAGSRLQLENHSGQEVVVLGYKDAARLKTEADLAALQSREDFRRLLQELMREK